MKGNYTPEGVIAAMLTPMTESEEINEKELRRQVRRFHETRIDGLFCLGTNGEFYALSAEEKLLVMRIVIEENQGKLPVFAGTGCVTTKETVLLSQRAQELGAAAVSVVTPYFGETSQDALLEHYKSVAGNLDIGVILYNIPARTGCSIARQTVEKLAAVPGIIGIKDSSGNFDQILQYLEATEREFPVFAGNDSLILPTLLAGGAGAISGIANLFPNRLSDIRLKWRSGELEEAWSIQSGLRPIRDCLRLGNPNSVVKRAANLLGYEVGPARSPFGENSERIDEQLKKILVKYDGNWN